VYDKRVIKPGDARKAFGDYMNTCVCISHRIAFSH